MSEQIKGPNSELHTILAAALIPLIQSLLTGLVVSIVSFAIALTSGKENPWLWLLWGFLLPVVGVWVFSIRRWFKLTDWLPYVEKVTNIDINRDGQIGSPEPKRMTVTVRDVRDGMFLRMNHYELPASEEQVHAFALGVGQGLSLAEANWIGPSNPFARDEYRAFRGELIRRRWVELASHKSTNQGFQMTRAGQAVMREIAKANSPTLDVDV